MEKEIVKYNGCFICGPNNPIGLNLKFFTDGKITRTVFKPDLRHEGYKGILHGGIIAAVLDEVMIKAVLALDIRCVTASMEVRYKAPAHLGKMLTFEAEVLEAKGRIFKAKGVARTEDRRVFASARGTFMTVSAEFEEKLKESLEG